MTLSIVNHVLVVLFVAACIAGIVCFLWTTVFLIKMGFQFSEPSEAFSARTLWNPLNALFSPDLLSPEGRHSRRLLFMGVLGFILSIAIALGAAGLVWVANKM
jgi:hypothetical protein